jgi:hypothetical protein
MPYDRPKSSHPLDKAQRTALLQDYFNYYREAAKIDEQALNQKLPRGASDDLLDHIGCLLLSHATVIANTPGPVRDFLSDNPLPKSLEELLPDDFRAFCLALNALKQWLAAEQAATDRYLLGGKARQECRDVATTCVVTGEPLAPGEAELHHPVRDGRPPIPLSKHGHARLEGQAGSSNKDSLRAKILAIKRQLNRSWPHLRKGCFSLLGKEASHSTPAIAASSKAFARKVAKETDLTFEEIIAWLDTNNL